MGKIVRLGIAKPVPIEQVGHLHLIYYLIQLFEIFYKEQRN
jgi:hypothetical protein